MLANRPGKPSGHAARTVIATSLLLAAGFMGWLIGRSGQPELWRVQDFAEQAIAMYLRPHLATDSSNDIALLRPSQPFNRLSQQVAVPLQPPDLTPQGFTLIDKHLITANGPQTAQVTYATPGGRQLSLFLRTRWREEAPQFHFAENKGVTMVYWLEGPLVYALVGRLDRQEMFAVVQTIRRSMRHQPPGDPQQNTEIATTGPPLRVPHDQPTPINPVQRATQTN
jgi:anti-sigma factor RsiW